jgi:hypothetical protein
MKNSGTKTIVIGQKSKTSKSISFCYLLDSAIPREEKSELIVATQVPNQFNYVELICENYTHDMDLMFAYNNPKNRSDGSLFAGHWNDGVVD